MLLYYLSFICFAAHSARAIEYDEDLAQSLKSQANHNLNRLKAFREEKKNDQIFDEEREKALALHLEEQERWDLLRERGLREYRLTKKQNRSKESGPDYLAYLEQVESELARYEKVRRAYANTKRLMRQQVQNEIGFLELEELGLTLERPRFNVRRRAQNKWVNSSSRLGGSGGGSASFYQPPAPPPSSDFSPSQDFLVAPPAFETFDEVQPAVPPPVFESFEPQPISPMPFDGGGEGFSVPPPPPPPDFEF